MRPLNGIVPDLLKIGTHSIRSGGASPAANAGISDCLFKRHGRWLSDNAKDGYVKDSLSARLSVSKALEIQFLVSFPMYLCIYLAQPGRSLDVGYSWPGVFLIGESGLKGRFFTQLLSHNPCSG